MYPYHLISCNRHEDIVILRSLVITVILYAVGTDSCQWLLGNGRFQGYGIWQPYGCMMHKFSKRFVCGVLHFKRDFALTKLQITQPWISITVVFAQMSLSNHD